MRFRTKTIIAFLGTGLACIAGVGFVLSRMAENALRESAISRVVSLREATAGALQTYYKALLRQLLVLADCPVVSEGLETLAAAVEKLPQEWGKPINRDELARAIVVAVNGSLTPTGLPGEQSPADMVAQNTAGLLLQDLYIARNPIPAKRLECADVGDGSTYSRAHARLHPLYLSYFRKFQFHDFFLIDPDGRVVYSVLKTQDLGTNLRTGPLRDTSLATAFKAAIEQGQDDPPAIGPFTFYPPSGMEPAAFIACPLIHDGRKVGVVA